MNRNAPMAGRNDDSWIRVFTHVLIWLLLAGSCLLLAWFVAVLHDSTERGEQRRLQQRTLASPLFSETKTGEVR